MLYTGYFYVGVFERNTGGSIMITLLHNMNTATVSAVAAGAVKFLYYYKLIDKLGSFSLLHFSN